MRLQATPMGAAARAVTSRTRRAGAKRGEGVRARGPGRAGREAERRTAVRGARWKWGNWRNKVAARKPTLPETNTAKLISASRPTTVRIWMNHLRPRKLFQAKRQRRVMRSQVSESMGKGHVRRTLKKCSTRYQAKTWAISAYSAPPVR